MTDSVVELSPSGLYYPLDGNSTSGHIGNILYLTNYAKGSGSVAKSATGDLQTKVDGFLIFKIKSTKPNHYVVRPKIGLLYPESSRALKISLKPIDAAVADAAVTGKDRHCFQVEVRRVVGERALNQVLAYLKQSPVGGDAAVEKKTTEAMKTLFDASSGSVVRSWNLTCQFTNLRWSPYNEEEARTTEQIPFLAKRHLGSILETDESGKQIRTIEASVHFPEDGDASLAPSPNPSATSVGRSAGRYEGTPSATPSTAPPVDLVTQTAIQAIEERIEKKQSEEAQLKAELQALKNQTTQLEADCQSVLDVSVRNARKLDELEKESLRRRKKYGTIQYISIPAPAMFVLMCITFIVALFLRPKEKM